MADNAPSSIGVGLDFGLGLWRLHIMVVQVERPWEKCLQNKNLISMNNPTTPLPAKFNHNNTFTQMVRLSHLPKTPKAKHRVT
jgi:hypothetical protein